MRRLPLPWRAFLVLGLSTTVVIAAASNPYGLAAIRAGLLIPEVFRELPIHPLAAIGEAIDYEEVAYGDFPDGVAGLYRPTAGGRHPALVVVLGAVVPGGRFDPRVVRMATTAARAGAVTMVVESANLNQNRVVAEDIEKLIAAFQYLQGQPFVNQGRVSFASFSVGAALALVAAQDARISDQVDAVLAFGTYYDLRDLIAAITTRRIVYDDSVEQWQPRPKTVTVLRRSVIATLPDADERQELSRLLEGNPDAASGDDRISGLSRDAQAIFRLLVNNDPDQVGPLLSQLSPESRAALARLSPSSHIDQLKARLFIVASRDDNLLPYAESRRLRDAIAARGDYHYTELSVFRHVDISLSPNILTLGIDLVKLYLAIYWLVLATT